MSSLTEFQIFIGIDQTGAVDSKGIPRKLDACIIDNTSGLKKIFLGLKLKKLTHDELSTLIKAKIPHFKNQKVLICVDAVLGLPVACSCSMKQIFKKIKNFSFHEKSYGALTAHAFFNQFLKDGMPKNRVVELKVKANSVFNLKPFQRNIGCGTYRILRELAQEKRWFDLWPFEKNKKQFLITEGYPSHFWKSLFGINTRNISLLQSRFKRLRFKTVDEADSLLLAYGALKSEKQLWSEELPLIAKKEGWILGVPFR